MDTSSSNDKATALGFLARDPFRHIMLLKYWSAFEVEATLRLVRDGEGLGVRILIPTERSPYDRKAYPQTDYVGFVRAETQELARALLEDLPRDRAVIFKLVEESDIAAVRSARAVVRQTAFVSYTAPPIPPVWRVHGDIAIARSPSPGALPLHAAEGYDREEVLDYAANSAGRFYSSSDAAAAPLGACFSFRNFEDIHEIGGLFTRPEARRRGIARRLVETALATLGGARCRPRYQVHEQNAASIALALDLGLVAAVTAEHWLYVP